MYVYPAGIGKKSGRSLAAEGKCPQEMRENSGKNQADAGKAGKAGNSENPAFPVFPAVFPQISRIQKQQIPSSASLYREFFPISFFSREGEGEGHGWGLVPLSQWLRSTP
jgi:hypothetical protein